MKVTGTTRLAGIIGWPVSHSRSPLLHGFWLDETGIDGAYVPLPVKPDHIERALRALPVLGFRGCNLTVPHKQAALAVVDRVDSLARRIGAINTVVVAPDGSLEGTNTDAFGFRESLREAAPHWKPSSGPVVILGAGGAARAIIVALGDAGAAEIHIVNRTLDRAAAVAADLSTPRTTITIHSWEEVSTVQHQAGLLVNATSLGMVGEPPLTLHLSSLPLSAPVVDIVYVPVETELLAAARRGASVWSGGAGTVSRNRPIVEGESSHRSVKDR